MLPSCWELLLLPRSQSLGSTSPVDNSIENLLSPISTISDTYLGSPDQQRLTIASACLTQCRRLLHDILLYSTFLSFFVRSWRTIPARGAILEAASCALSC